MSKIKTRMLSVSDFAVFLTDQICPLLSIEPKFLLVWNQQSLEKNYISCCKLYCYFTFDSVCVRRHLRRLESCLHNSSFVQQGMYLINSRIITIVMITDMAHLTRKGWCRPLAIKPRFVAVTIELATWYIVFLQTLLVSHQEELWLKSGLSITMRLKQLICTGNTVEPKLFCCQS